MMGRRLKTAINKARKTERIFLRMGFDGGPRWLGIYRKTRVFYSSPFCCGNPRRGLGNSLESLTLQERKAEISQKEQLADLNKQTFPEPQ